MYVILVVVKEWLWNNKFDCLVMKVFVLLKGMYNWLDVSFIRINFVFDMKCNDVFL